MKEPPTLLHRLEKWVDTCMAHLPRPRPAEANITNARLVAHRGAHDTKLQIIENTHAAFERSVQLGCHGIELDVQTCADNTLVINHDPTLKRLWGHDVAINTVDVQTLHALAPAVPRLSEVVHRYGKRIHLFIELKAPFTNVKELAIALQSLTPCEDYHLISLDATMLPLLATCFPKTGLILVPVHNNVNAFCTLSLEQHYGGVLGHYLLLNNRQIKRLVNANQLIGVGFVDSTFSLYRELNRGLQYLFSNNVAIIADSLQKLQDPPFIP